MRERRRKFTPEFKDEAVKMVIESSRPVAEVAREIQVNEGTLGNWVHKYRLDHVGEEPPLSVSDRARLRELERENRELKMKAEFLGKAAAFFAQAPGTAGTRAAQGRHVQGAPGRSAGDGRATHRPLRGSRWPCTCSRATRPKPRPSCRS